MNTFTVTLVNDSTLSTFTTRRFVRGKTQALELAERLAGESAEFFRYGESYGYAGSAGAAYVADTGVAE